MTASSSAIAPPQDWILIEPNYDIVSPRRNLAVAALDTGEIVLMGGYRGKCLFSDVIVFDTRTNACTKVIERSSFKFDAMTNQTVRGARGDSILTLAVEGKTDRLCLLEFNRRQNSLNPLKVWNQ